MQNNIQYSKKYICYIDILGFRDMINVKSAMDIYNIVNMSNIIDKILKENDLYKHIDLFYFSDTFVLIIDSGYHIDTIGFIIGALLRYLWNAKIATRGALSYGDVYYSKERNILFGPAFIKAYDLEKKAKYARVIIDKDINTETLFYKFHERNNPFLQKIFFPDISDEYDVIHPYFSYKDEGYKFIEQQLEYFAQKNDIELYNKYYYPYLLHNKVLLDD